MLSLVEYLDRHTLADETTIRKTLACLLAGYPVLLEGLPGVGKTGLAQGVSKALNRSLTRIQCTPDIQPADITGYLRPDPKGEAFIFVEGPVFSPFLLIDEINRAHSRSQAALLEAMAEGSVTVEGKTHQLSSERVVIATQNPQDQVGTNPLPESQLDRFGLALVMGYPSLEKESQVLARKFTQPTEPPHIDIAELRHSIHAIEINDKGLDYLHRLIAQTRNDSRFRHGLSTRGALVLADLGRAMAALEGRSFVTPVDIQQIFSDVARHRLTLVDQRTNHFTPDECLQEVLAEVAL